MKLRILFVLPSAILLFLFAACPGPQNATGVPGERQPVPDRPADGVDMTDPVQMLNANLVRLEARFERYRVELPETPGLGRARELLDEARAGIDELRSLSLDREDMPFKLHAVNTRFYEVEQIIPPLD